MIVNSIDRVTQGVRALVADPDSITDDGKLARVLGTFFESTNSDEEHAWLDMFPKMKLWIDDKQAEPPSARSLIIKNDDYESTVVVHKNEIADDKLGMIALRMRSAFDEANRHYLEGIFALMANAFVTPCYDGEYFIDTDHPGPGGASWSNKQSGALSEANLNAAIAKLMKIPNKNGEPVGARPTHVIASPDDRATLLAILALYGPMGASNINSGLLEPVISARLPAGAWFVGDFTRPVKPFLVQVREPIRFVEQDPNSANGGPMEGGPMSESRFMRGILRFGFEARTGFGYGLPQLIVGSTGL